MTLYQRIESEHLNGEGQYLAGYFRIVNRPHWRKPDEILGYVGDRIVAICLWSEHESRPAQPHVITLTIQEDGVTRDNEDRGHCLEDCDYWMPEAEFLRLFGPEVQQ